MGKIILLSVAFISIGALCKAQSDDRRPTFETQANNMAELGEVATGLVRCGVRSSDWAWSVKLHISTRIAALANKTWPADRGTDADAHTHALSLWRAFRALDQAAERGEQAGPKWCADVGPDAAAILDDFSRG